jgi:hypothetical protein
VGRAADDEAIATIFNSDVRQVFMGSWLLSFVLSTHLPAFPYFPTALLPFQALSRCFQDLWTGERPINGYNWSLIFTIFNYFDARVTKDDYIRCAKCSYCTRCQKILFYFYFFFVPKLISVTKFYHCLFNYYSHRDKLRPYKGKENIYQRLLDYFVDSKKQMNLSLAKQTFLTPVKMFLFSFIF